MGAMNAATAELIDSLKFPSYTTDDTQTMATAANEIEYLVARTKSDEAKLESQSQTIERLTRELDAVIQQARIWSQEAKTQKATVNEVGAILGGIPDWGPISKNVAAVVKDAERYRRIRLGLSDRHGDVYAMIFAPDGDYPESGEKLDVAIDASIAISATGKHLMERVDYIDEQGYAHMKVPK